jgi:hypothetical protein
MNAGEHNDDRQTQGDIDQNLAKLLQPVLQRRFLGVGILDQVGNLAHLRIHPGPDDHWPGLFPRVTIVPMKPMFFWSPSGISSA